jgi:hypothetical protein
MIVLSGMNVGVPFESKSVDWPFANTVRNSNGIRRKIFFITLGLALTLNNLMASK